MLVNGAKGEKTTSIFLNWALILQQDLVPSQSPIFMGLTVELGP